MLAFHFFGAPRLETQDAKGTAKHIELDTRKAMALAAYLALTPQAHERDELAAFFYPDADTSRARAALRRTLSTLKTALGDNSLEIERETLALNRNGVWVDVFEFRALVQQNSPDALARAAQLYQGDFLAGFTLRDSPAFDEWQFFETESLRKQFAAVLEQLVAQESAQRRYKRGIEYARRWLQLDPLHEPAHRALMLLYARDGQRAAALRQYQECVRQLEQELGVAPLPETTELYRAIQENRATDDGRKTKDDRRQTTEGGLRAEQTRQEAAYSYPFVGRERELETLVNAYAEMTERGSSSMVSGPSPTGGRLMIIQGEAGIGKTRLAEEFLMEVRRQGADILAAQSYAEQRALAYAPFVQALQTAVHDSHLRMRLEALPPPVLADAARLVPELTPGGSAPTLDNAGAQARFFDAIAQVILKLAGDAPPGILFLDDAQWLDEASLDLLAFLIRRLKNAPLCILLTWRAQEITNDHTLRRLYADALREERATLVSLSRLAKPDVQTLVNVATGRGAPIHPQLAERIYRETEGQPFFLIESLKLIEREGQLPEGDALPATVRELLHSRLARVSETARQLLSAAAVIGHSFDFETLDRVSGRSEQETIQGLEELSAQGLIVEEMRAGAPQYDFTHEKLRALVYSETLLARRRLLHRRTAEALMQGTRSSPAASEGQTAGQIAGQIAHHLRSSGDEARAAEFFKSAGDYARSVFANRDAVENYTAALALGFPDAALLHTSIGDAQTLLGEYDAALASYETAAAFGATDADANLARVYLRRGEWERAAHHLGNALALTKKSSAQALLYADLALAQHQSDKDAAALKQAKRALALAQKGKDTRALAQVHNILGILARTRGAWDAARKHLEASRTLAEKEKDTGAHAAALNNLALVAHAMQDDARALELTQRALELVTRAGDRHRQAALHNHLADIYHALGREADSMEELKCAVAIYAEIGGPVGAWQPEIWKLEEW